MGVSTPSTLMPTGMGVANPQFSKSDRKPKKTKHCTIPKTLTRKEEQKECQKKELGLINMKVEIKETIRFKMVHKSQVWGSY